ncbi:MAG: prephenate dehydrogenase/arogenate dehydrogenase family protein [Bacillota bacterium]
MISRVAILGLGMIGGSLGLVFTQVAGLEVAGYDREPETIETALRMGAVNRTGSMSELAAWADVVFLCTPVSTIPGLAREMARSCRPGCLLTDVGSTKQDIVEVFDSLTATGLNGIGGHPMAGSERQGITGADRYLFENAVYILTPGKNTSPGALEELRALLVHTGAHVITMDAETHDRLVASVSHLPHLVASALVNMLVGQDEALALAASGFRDTTRVASGDPELWTEILLSNRRLLAGQLESFIDRLSYLKTILEEQRSRDLQEFLTTSRDIRESLPSKRKGLTPTQQEMVCVVPDKPGIIGSLGSYLGEKGINIADIEILRVREGDGGTIRIGLSREGDGPIAVETLLAHGIKAWIR